MLKDFLYLKEQNLKDVVELLLKAYTASFSDSEQTLKRNALGKACLLYTSPSPRDRTRSRMPSSA